MDPISRAQLNKKMKKNFKSTLQESVGKSEILSISKSFRRVTVQLLRTVINVKWKHHIIITKSCMGANPKYLKRCEIEDFTLQDTAVEVGRSPYLGYFCGNQSMGRG